MHRFVATTEVCLEVPGLILSICLKDGKALQDAKMRLINNRLQRIKEQQVGKDKWLTDSA